MEHAAIPLTPRGRIQAEHVAKRLPPNPDAVFVSRFARTIQTSDPYCRRVGQTAIVHPLLHEFSAIDPALLRGMTGAQRRPIADAYWERADPHERMGTEAETFAEFNARVRMFLTELPNMPCQSVLFGHGTWFGLLCWLLDGSSAAVPNGMRAFRHWQRAMPMGNVVIYVLIGSADGAWRWEIGDI